MGAILALVAGPAWAEIEVPGESVRFTWTPSSGPVLGYLVYLARNGLAERLYLATENSSAIVFAPVGTTLRLRVVPFDALASKGPSSEVSDLVRLVADLGPDPPDEGDPGDPPGSGDPDGDPPGSGDPDDDPPPPAADLPPVAMDFDGNGYSDLPIREPSTGQFRILDLRDNLDLREIVSAVIPVELALVGTGDYDGDGVADLLWQRPASPAQVILSSGSGGLELVQGLSTARVVGSGDFDGDGRDDIVAMDPGRNVLKLWLMDGAELLDVVNAGRRNSQYEIAASADVDGDGLTEVVALLGDSGWLQIVQLEGGEVDEEFVTADGLGEGWRVIGACDTDGDEREELLWHDAATGAIHIWRYLADGSTSVEPLAAPAWGSPDPVAVGDFDADGRPELITEDSTGGVSMWFLDGANIVGHLNVIRLVPSWNVEAVGSENPKLQ